MGSPVVLYNPVPLSIPKISPVSATVIRPRLAGTNLATSGMFVQMRAEDKFIYTMPSAAELG